VCVHTVFAVCVSVCSPCVCSHSLAHSVVVPLCAFQVVTWSTMAITPTSTVEYSPQSSSSWTSQSTSIASPVLRRIQKTLPRSITFTETATGSATNFTDGGSEHHSQMIHRVTLTDLTPNTPYVYHCGDKSTGWSSVFTFTSMPSGPAWSPRYVCVCMCMCVSTSILFSSPLSLSLSETNTLLFHTYTHTHTHTHTGSQCMVISETSTLNRLPTYKKRYKKVISMRFYTLATSLMTVRVCVCVRVCMHV